MKLETVYQALQHLRCPFVPREDMLHEAVAECLRNEGISFVHEAKLDSHCRIDFLVEDIGIEIKKGRPNTKILSSQLRRYASCEAIKALIVIAPYSVKLPTGIYGKPVYCINLNVLWGVALS